MTNGDNRSEDFIHHGDTLGVLAEDNGRLNKVSGRVITLKAQSIQNASRTLYFIRTTATAKDLAARIFGLLDVAQNLIERVLGTGKKNETPTMKVGEERT
jgi:hypothetical protein